MKVSVKMLTYNHELYVAQAIEGVLAQVTDFPVELIVGDDASRDATADIIRDYASRYPQIKATLRTANVGMVENFFGLDSELDGDFIAFCEGDDYWDDPYKLQKQVDFLCKNRDYAIVYTNVRQYVQNVGFKKEIPAASYSGFVLRELLKGAFMSTVTVMVRSSAYNEVKESVYQVISERNLKMIDYPLWIEIASKYKVHHLNDFTAVYRILGESASHSIDPERQIKFIESVLDVISHYSNQFSLAYMAEPGVASKCLTIYRTALIYKLPDTSKYRKQFLKAKSSTLKMKVYNFMARFTLTENILRYLLRTFTK